MARWHYRVEGFEELKRKLANVYEKVPGEVMERAFLTAAQDVVKPAIVRATKKGEHPPVMIKKGSAARRYPGHLARTVIVYRRKTKRRVLFRTATEKAMAVLVGYSKKGFYGYFLEHGRKGQAPQRFMQAAFDGCAAEATRVAEDILKAGLEQAAR